MASERAILAVLRLLTGQSRRRLKRDAAATLDSLRGILESNNVNGVGIADKVRRGRSTRELAMVFYVVKKKAPQRLRGSEMIPPVIPLNLSGAVPIVTDVVEDGRVRLQINKIRNPIRPGYSIANAADTAGTLGAVVSKRGRCMLLSNAHVLARSGLAKRGEDITYPGPGDGGVVPADVAATLADFVPLNRGAGHPNIVDCAIAEPVKKRLPDVRSDIKTLGFPMGTVHARRGMRVVKVGRTTDLTKGVVLDVHAAIKLRYPAPIGILGFRDQIRISVFSKDGDSGSLVLVESSKNAIGLHFAGGPTGSYSNPIAQVLRQLHVRLVTRQVSCAGKRGSRTVRGG
jgi:hypothetical protein